MLKIKPFRQKVGLCGPAVLKMVLDYYGIKATEAELAERTHCDPQLGIDAERMLEVVREMGMDGYIRDYASFADLEKLVVKEQIPVIVDWFSEDDGHYSVVVDLDSENIYLQDPEIGHLRAMRRAKFQRVWFDFPGDYIDKQEKLTIRRMIVIVKQ
ncbi:hypothetical protein COT54_00475 [Candidatus Collierbacteria bacterium CG09_land_8_20_14_0_10_46_12]|uniref:Peptidase C39 domain-containing protein n=1 Tax=Candidatus Collierbacteria bacterium CG09_land_8_20_14_0_10_46_12 TaxID=1974533 RepID=A0A2H0WZY1_9BACT|nr:MAG: hypothetical protein COT54_00475 [Candidatus Collierbacteria bacterium CG09_land_8_20_14_0_10_46_12]